MKKILLTLAAIITVALTVLAANNWVVVEDSCDRCYFDNSTRKCGLCGGFLSQVNGTGKFLDDGYLKYDYRCNKCKHTVTAKNK